MKRKITSDDLRRSAIQLRCEIVQILKDKESWNEKQENIEPLDVGIERVAIKLCDEQLEELDRAEREGRSPNNIAMKKLFTLYQNFCEEVDAEPSARYGLK